MRPGRPASLSFCFTLCPTYIHSPTPVGEFETVKMRPPIRPLALTIWLNSAWLSQAGVDVDGEPILALGDAVPIDEYDTYWTPLHTCPGPCSGTGSEEWMSYTSLADFTGCSEPLLLDFSLYNPIEPGSTIRLKACNAGKETESDSASIKKLSASRRVVTKRDETECPSGAPRKTVVSLPLVRGKPAKYASDDTLALLKQFSGYLQDQSSCTTKFLFGYSNGTVAGLYAGASYSSRSALSLLERVTETVKSGGASTTLVSQLCSAESNSNEVLGIAIDTTGNLAAVQKAVITWDAAECVEQGSTSELKDVSLWKIPEAHNTTTNSTKSEGDSKLKSRASGALSDIRPRQNSDGSCVSYVTITDDSCSKIATRNGLTQKELESFNDKTTWGWSGCDPKTFYAGMNICLSKGSPPMPAPVPNAVCGPLKPGSSQPTDGTKIEDMNPCPLNACCNIWGQCGISGEFCVKSPGATGNPGTSPAGKNGCVSSCGMSIVNNSQKPGNFGRIGYYESWNFNRPCLHMKVENANTDGTYTHIHWAFTEINTGDWTVKVADPYKQWNSFKSMPNVKKIISFGGWGYSTEPGTYDILRQAMSPANRAKFAANVASFLNKEGLDGVDFDWEYPGAPDIPGTPPGLPSDGPNYLKFLTVMRGSMARGPNGKSLSIAAPASFWYLKQFPIALMAKELDYIVYMTYDLHGQWDSGNKWGMEGCEGVTKAGVPTYKIFVGESSYGRSFKMAQAGCTGPNCKFLGDRLNSPAAPGRCTGTSGYISDAEINEIEMSGGNVKAWHDDKSDSDIMVYDNTEWVAYMKPATKLMRRVAWAIGNFAGTIDWAVDLQAFTNDEFEGFEDPGWKEPKPKDRANCTGTYDKLSAIPSDTPTHCRNLYILQSLSKMLKDTLTGYDTLINGGYDKKFNTYAGAVAQSGNKVLENFMFTKGNDYFQCKVWERYTCCEACHSFPAEDPSKSCLYCDDKWDCGWDSVCDNPEVLTCDIKFRFKEIDTFCPPNYSERSESNPWDPNNLYTSQAVTWRFRDGKKDQFYADLYTEAGIKEEDITWKNIQRMECTPSEPKEDCAKHNYDYNFPVASGYDRSDVLNPKDVVQDARGKLNSIGPDLERAIKEIRGGVFTGSDYDLVDALSLPITMVADAIDSMQTIDDLVDKWDADKRKNILMAFLSAIFFFVPVLGQVVGSIAALANIGRIIALAGLAGNVALGIHDVVDNPDNAALAIFGLVLEPLAIFDIAKMSRAATIRRAMDPADLAKLNAKPGSRMDDIRKANDFCARPTKKRDIPFGGLPMTSLNGIEYHAVEVGF
ncbi:putative glycoside hydrolase family 18 protein [Paramyrothecium foliicola]|nr:putative glycoside hydrolase family 18 protein [Paramyrothecium foliicola]